MTEHSSPEVVDEHLLTAVWRALRSLRFVLWLLAIIALASFLGELIPQRRLPEFYAAQFGPALARLIGLLCLDRIYSSWWFISLLGLILLSTIACAGSAVRRARSRAARADPTATAALIRAMRAATEFTLALPPQQALQQLAAPLENTGYTVRSTQTDEGWCLVGQKRRWASWGTVVAHLSFTLLAAGAIIGRLPAAGFETYLTAPGKPYPGLAPGDVWTDPRHRVNFQLKVLDFRLEYYDRSGAVKAYITEAAIIQDGRELRRQRIEVNHPLHYRGVSFYQSDWGLASIELIARKPGGKQQRATFSLTEEALDGARLFRVQDPYVALDDAHQEVLLAHRFLPDAVLASSHEARPQSNFPRAPALELFIVTDMHGETPQATPLGWVTERRSAQYKGWEFRLGRLTLYTGLRARRDPGLPLVWLGFVLAVLGLGLMLYFPTRLVRLMIIAEDTGSRVLLGGALRGLGSFEREFQRLRSVAERAAGPEPL